MLCKTKRDQGSNSQFLLKRGLFLVRMATELFALLLPYPTLIVKNKGATTAFFIKIILNTSISIEYIYYFRNCWLIKIFIRMSIVRNNCCFFMSCGILAQLKQFLFFFNSGVNLSSSYFDAKAAYGVLRFDKIQILFRNPFGLA